MSALLSLMAQGGFGDGHMGNWGWLAIVAMAVMMGGMGWMMWSMMRGGGGNGPGPSEDPVAVLKARYARGDLNTEEFRERLQTIEDARL
ncbi:MAG: SHOCT domain-containing protein [Solirubrobacteraceae bacterium]